MGVTSGFDNCPPRAAASTVAYRRRFAEINSKPVGFFSTPSYETIRTGTPRLTTDPTKLNDETARGAIEATMEGTAPPEADETSNLAIPETPECSGSVPVYAMLPLDTVDADGCFKYSKSVWFHEALRLLVLSGVKGVAVDVWWGVVEKNPTFYDWKGYRDLFDLIKPTGLSMQVVLSFHACGGNVGDVVQIPLPQWVLSCGETDPDVFLCDRPRMHRAGERNRECLSLFADEAPGILCGRSPMQCYTDFMAAFKDEFEPMLGNFIRDVVIGAGPCGELRYPSYSEANGWRFPGVGEFQCYDRHALSSLASAAVHAGHPEWGMGGPHNAGEYNDRPDESSFFCPQSGSWNTQYGRFFLQWYSNQLLQHGRRLLRSAHAIFGHKLRQKTPMAVPRASESLMNGVRTWLAKTGGRLCRSPSTASASDYRVSESSMSCTGRTNSMASILRDASLGSFTRESMSCNSYPSAAIPADIHSCPSLSDMGYRPVFDVETGEFTPIRAPDSSSAESTNGEDVTSSVLAKRWDAGELLRRFMRFSKHAQDCPPGLQLSLKIAGVHWWYRTHSHGAELAAGYYNAGDRCGYTPIVQLCQEFDVALTLTCVEMCDAQHPPEMYCSPQGLLTQIRKAASAAGVRLSGENALPLFYPGQGGVDLMGLNRVVQNCHESLRDSAAMQLPSMNSFTFLRLGPEITSPAHVEIWKRFMERMRRPYERELNGAF